MSDPFEFEDRRSRERTRRRDDDDMEYDRRRRPARDDRDEYEDRPRRRRERGYDDDPPPRRPPPPPIELKVPRSLPASISLAGTGWIIFGSLNMLSGTIVLILAIVTLVKADELAGQFKAQEKAFNQRGLVAPNKDQIQTAAVQQGAMAAFSLLVGLLFFIFGVAVVRSRARDVIGQAITSLVLAGILFLAFFLLVGALKVDGRDAIPDQVRTTIWISTISSLLHCMLLGGSGIAALIGRRDYQLWVGRGRRAAPGGGPENPNAMTGDDFASTFG